MGGEQEGCGISHIAEVLFLESQAVWELQFSSSGRQQVPFLLCDLVCELFLSLTMIILKGNPSVHTMMQKIFHTDIIKPELYLLGFMDQNIRKLIWESNIAYGNCGKLLYPNSWRNNEKPAMEDWFIKLIELAEMVKLTNLEKKMTKIVLKDWNLGQTFC